MGPRPPRKVWDQGPALVLSAPGGAAYRGQLWQLKGIRGMTYVIALKRVRWWR
jgi:hypothetical protein